MKDAKGHGSDPRGSHSGGVNQIGKFAPNMTSYEAFNYVQSLHSNPEDFAEGDLADRIEKNNRYSLTEIPVSKLNADEFTVYPDQVASYAKQPALTSPPILIDRRGSIIDGVQRVNAAKVRGDKTILAYVGKK